MKPRRKWNIGGSILALLLASQVLAVFGIGAPAKFNSSQGAVTSIGILSFADESGGGVPPEFGRKIAQDLQQKILATHEDILPRVVGTKIDVRAIGALTVEQIVVIGQGQGVQYVITGGLLSSGMETVGREDHATIQLYARIVAVQDGRVNNIRAKGEGTQTGLAMASPFPLASTDFSSGQFPTSAWGLALSDAMEKLAESVYQIITAGVTEEEAPIEQSPEHAEVEPDKETEAAEPEEIDEAEGLHEASEAQADEELQQLIAQAQELLSNPMASSGESLDLLNRALEGLQAALESKATLMEQGEDTVQADGEIAARKGELESAISTLQEQVEERSFEEPLDEENQESAPERNSVQEGISQILGETSNILREIREMRAAERSVGEEVGDEPEEPAEQEQEEAGSEESVEEESFEEISGVVMEEGSPVEGVTVTDPESGASDTTDEDGYYSLEKVPSGRLVNLIVAGSGSQLATGQVDLIRGRSASADFEVKPLFLSGPTLKIIPSQVSVRRVKSKRGQTGILKGVVRDAQGRPVPRALVNLKGLAVARTDSQGRYVFMNVPAGTYQVVVNKSGLRLKTEQVRVVAKKKSDSSVRFVSSDKIVKPRAVQPLVIKGAGTALRGKVVDQKRRPISRAKVTVFQSSGAVSVRTGSRGRYLLRDLKPGSYRVIASRAGYQGKRERVTLRVGKTELQDFHLKKKTSPPLAKLVGTRPTVRVKPSDRSPAPKVVIPRLKVKTGRLTGRVLDAQNKKPIRGAVVSIRGRGSARTASNGNYALRNLPPGNYRIRIKRSGYQELQRTARIRAGKSVRRDFRLAKVRLTLVDRTKIAAPTVRPKIPTGIRRVKFGHVRGRVTNAKTGKPVAGATISIGRKSVKTNSRGSYAFSGLAPGTHKIVVKRSGYAQTSRTLRISAGKTSTANFRLSSLRIIRPIRIKPKATDDEYSREFVIIRGWVWSQHTVRARPSYRISRHSSSESHR